MSRKNGLGARPKTVTFRVPEGDYAALLQRCSDANMKPSEFLRDVVLANRTRIVPRKKPGLDVVKVAFQIQKAGNNLDQIAHQLQAARLAGAVSDAVFERAANQLFLLNAYLSSTLSRVL